jgi:hypothetical protein
MSQSQKSYFKVFGSLALAAGVFFGTAFIYSNNAEACALTNWPDTSSATGQACDPSAGCPRYQGQCSYQADASSIDFVAHGGGANGAAGAAQEFQVRFYVYLNDLTAGNVTVFSAVNGATPVIDLSVTAGTPNQFTLTSGALSIGPVDAVSGWNKVVIGRTAANVVSLTVNDTAVPGSGAGSNMDILNAQLGSVDTASGAGNIYFDSYVANRTTVPVDLPMCDPDNSGGAAPTNVDDVIALINEINGASFATGTPDCVPDGSINVDDVISAINIIFN